MGGGCRTKAENKNEALVMIQSCRSSAVWATQSGLLGCCLGNRSSIVHPVVLCCRVNAGFIDTAGPVCVCVYGSVRLLSVQAGKSNISGSILSLTATIIRII